MRAIGRQPCSGHRAPDGAPVHYERLRLEQTTLYRLVQQHAEAFFADAEPGHKQYTGLFVPGKAPGH